MGSNPTGSAKKGVSVFYNWTEEELSRFIQKHAVLINNTKDRSWTRVTACFIHKHTKVTIESVSPSYRNCLVEIAETINDFECNGG